MLQPTITQTNLAEAIKSAMNSAGFGAVFDEYTGGTDRFLIYQLTFDPSKVYGTVFLVIKITNALGVTQRLYTNWNKTTRIGDNPGTETSTSSAILANNSQVDFVGFTKSPEFRLVALYQGTVSIFLGYVRPETKPNWWEENNFPFVFIPTSNSNFVTWYSTGLSPYSGSIGTRDRFSAHINVGQFSAPNPVTNRRDILSNILFYAHSNEGIAARSSSDLAMMASTNLVRRDIIQVSVGVEEYYLLNNVVGGLGVRII